MSYGEDTGKKNEAHIIKLMQTKILSICKSRIKYDFYLANLQQRNKKHA